MLTLNNLLDTLVVSLDIKSEQLDPEQDFSQLEEWDSLKALQVLRDIETTFSTKLPLRAYMETQTPQQLFELIKRQDNPND